MSGIVIGAVVGLLCVFVLGVAVGGANNNGQGAVQAGFGMLICFGWVGLVVGGALGGIGGAISAAITPDRRDLVDRERAGQFRLLQRDLAQAEAELDERDSIIRELRAEIARLRDQRGEPGVGD